MIVLNYLLGINATRLDVSEYYEYLETLPTEYKTKALSRYDIFKSRYK